MQLLPRGRRHTFYMHLGVPRRVLDSFSGGEEQTRYAPHSGWAELPQDVLTTGLMPASCHRREPEGFLRLCQGGNLITSWWLGSLNSLYIDWPLVHYLIYAFLLVCVFQRLSLEQGSEHYSLLARCSYFYKECLLRTRPLAYE